MFGVFRVELYKRGSVEWKIYRIDKDFSIMGNLRKYKSYIIIREWGKIREFKGIFLSNLWYGYKINVMCFEMFFMDNILWRVIWKNVYSIYYLLKGIDIYMKILSSKNVN